MPDDRAKLKRMQDSSTACAALVRAGDRDRFLTSLFVPAEHRSAILALYAFNLEIARIREVVRQPFAGEVRLQWWSDVLHGRPRSEPQGNPAGAAINAAIAKYGLDRARLLALIDARRFDLYNEPMGTLSDLEAYAQAAAGGLISLCAQILDNGREPDVGALSRHAGVAQAIAGLLAAFAVHAQRGQLYVPLDVLRRHGADRQGVERKEATVGLRAALAELRRVARSHLERARELSRSVPSHLMPAYLPAVLAGPTLARMERRDYHPFAPFEISEWRRQWLIWHAARRPDRIFRSY
jgi:15-cis-phytoene synthase